MVGIAGLLFGFGLCFVRPGVACGLAGVSMLLIAWLGITLTWQTRVWSAWSIPVGAQIPLAVAWSWLAYAKRLRREKESLKAALTKTAEQLARVTPATGSAPPAIPDFSLLKRVGEGGYGEVWLARNAVGMFHAVKLVRRAAFASEEPYEREFRGIQHFMPISRSHPGLVHVLHVGRNEDAGFFFCAMEASDDEVSGRQIDANSYSPRTLAKDLARHGPLPVEECARLGAALAAALEHLHQRRLIHRDLKPANIIYVEGEPKLADIGLVTGMGGPADSVSRVGTEGFVAPEGPGTAAADIYSLGKVLYEAGMGADRRRFPELPTAIYDAADHPRRMQLNEIIVKACATKAEERYRSAEELRADLEKLVDVMRDA
jgi:serine/threonine protein kinase